MKVLKHLVFLVAVITTGQADEIPDRIRRDDNQIPVGGKLGTYGSFSVNPNKDAQLNTEIGEGGANEHHNLINSFGGLNEAGVSFGSEAKAVGGYDGEGQLTGGNIIDNYSLAPPSAGFGYGKQFNTAAQASTSVEVQAGETAINGETAQVDATAQAKLQAQFGQTPLYGAETQEKQGVQYVEGTKVQTPYHPVMIKGLMTYGSTGPILYIPGQGTFEKTGRGFFSHFSGSTPPTEPLGIPQVDTDPSSIYYNGPPVYQYAQLIPPSFSITDNGSDDFKPMANGYEVGDSIGMESEYVIAKKGAKGAAQMSKGIKFKPYSESSPYNDKGKDVFLNGEGFKAYGKSRLQSGQFGGAVGAEPVAQAGTVIETRFGQSTHPPRRPMPGLGYRQPYNGWKIG